jgi:hypothetical protein
MSLWLREANNTLSRLVGKFTPFLEDEVSIPGSKEPVTGRHLEPFVSSPHTFTYFITILIVFYHLSPGMPSGLFPFRFAFKITRNQFS